MSTFLMLLLFPFWWLTYPEKTLPEKQGAVWQTLEWSVDNPTYEGNPFDLEAQVTFTHQESEETRQVALFYDDDDTWKFRFTATQPGEWSLQTASSDPDLNGMTGTVTITDNPDADAHGFMTSFGNKWGWQGTEEAFIPQYVMGKDLEYYYDLDKDQVKENLIDEDIQEFVTEHGFTGFHLSGKAQWFRLGAGEDDAVNENPDVRTYQVLETIIRKVHEQGGACHLWLWGADGKNDDKGGPGGIAGGAMSEMDQRNLRYLAARLGPLPGWSMGYGFDTENGWATQEQLNTWKAFLEERTGWDHFLGARVGYDDKGQWALKPMPPKPPLDEKNNAPIGDEYASWLGGDYTGYTSYRPMYERYQEAMQHQPQKPSFEEDRFRLRDREKWNYKDYNEPRTVHGLWYSAMAGGVANIWGNLLPEGNHGGSQPYQVDTINIKDQIKTYAQFFDNRFKKDMQAATQGEAKYLATPDQSQVLIYQEDAEAIEISLKNAPAQLRAVAVDANKAYQEIELGEIKTQGNTWKAPYPSDWALALGDFEQKVIPEQTSR